MEKTSEVVAVVAAVGFVDRDNQQEAAKQSVKRSHFTVRLHEIFLEIHAKKWRLESLQVHSTLRKPLYPL